MYPASEKINLTEWLEFVHSWVMRDALCKYLLLVLLISSLAHCTYGKVGTVGISLSQEQMAYSGKLLVTNIRTDSGSNEKVTWVTGVKDSKRGTITMTEWEFHFADITKLSLPGVRIVPKRISAEATDFECTFSLPSMTFLNLQDPTLTALLSQASNQDAPDICVGVNRWDGATNSVDLISPNPLPSSWQLITSGEQCKKAGDGPRFGIPLSDAIKPGTELKFILHSKK